MTTAEAFEDLLIDLRLREKSLIELQQEKLSVAKREASPVARGIATEEVERIGHKLEGLRLAIFWTDHHRKIAAHLARDGQ